MTVNVFVYGTLMPGECNHDFYCRPFLQRATVGYVHGQIYHLPVLGYPGVCEGTDRIWGYCLSFSPAYSLTAMDGLEDYDPQRDAAHNEYNRCQTIVFTPNGDRLGEAWIYRMDQQKIRDYQGIYLPSGRWSATNPVIHPDA